MTPEQLVERLEGLLDERIVKKLRREIENAEKEVTPARILKFLVKKEQITQAQAQRLLRESERPVPTKHEKIEVSQPVDTYDTSDLTANINEPAPASQAPAKAKIEKDVVQAIPDDATTTDVIEAIPEPEPAAYQDPLADPFGDPNFATPQSATTSGANPQPELGTRFGGKRYKPNQWQTKWLYIGFGILGTLLLFGAVLYVAVGRQSAEDLYKAINKSFNDGTFGDAINKITTFLEKFPNDENAPKVKALRVNALIAETYERKNWNETISRTESLMPELIDDEDVDLSALRQDLGIILPTTALRITERALQKTTPAEMEAELEVSRNAQTIATRAAYVPTSEQKRRADLYQNIKDNILMVEGRIVKEKRYDATIVEIANLSEAGQTDQAFEKYRLLTQDYADLAARPQLRQQMLAVSVKERELVKPAEFANRPSSDQLANSVDTTSVLASQNGDAIPALLQSITPILAEGTLYGVDTGDGSVHWRRFLGFETTIQPQPLGQDNLIVADQRNHHLMNIARANNQLNWRLDIGEPFVSPAVSEAFLVVTTRSGKIIKVNSSTGAVESSCQLPQGANVPALIAERDPYIYQPGNYSNIYVLANDDLSCRDVYYVGHRRGSIQIPPVFWSGYILLTVNGGNSCDLHVLRGENGLDLKLIQLFPALANAPVTNLIQRIGRWMLVAAENGELTVLTINPVEEERPVSKAVEQKTERRGTIRTQIQTSGTVLFLAGKGITRYKLKANQNTFQKPLILNHADTFIAPMAVVDDKLIHVRRRDGSRMVSVSAVDSTTLQPIWRTDLGAPLAGSPRVDGDQIVGFSSQGDMFQFGADAAFINTAVKSSTIVENLYFDQSLPVSPNQDVCVGPTDRSDFLYVDRSANTSKLMRFPTPADRPACRPIVLGGDLIVASEAGPIVRVDARIGTMVGTPFQPPIRPGELQKWKRPAAVSESSIVIANVADENNSVFYLLDGSNRSALTSIAQMDSANVLSDIAAIGSTAYAVVQGEQGEDLIALDTSSQSLTPAGTHTFEASIVGGPWTVGDTVLVANDSDQLVAFDSQLNQKWTYKLPEIRMAAEPTVHQDRVLLAFENGRVELIQSSDGSVGHTLDLQQPIDHAPTVSDDTLYFGGMDGTVHSVKLNR